MLLLLLLAGCQPGGPVTHERLPAFGSTVEIEIGGGDRDRNKQAIAEAAALLDRRTREWHAWKPSDLTRINAAFKAGQAVEAPDSIIDLVRRSQAFSRSSDGLLDPAVGGLVELWGFHAAKFPVTTPAPSAGQIETWVQSHPSVLDISIQGHNLSSRNPAVQLDFKAIAEGVVAQNLADIFHRHGIANALISFGSDAYALGIGDSRSRHVGMKDPYGGALGGVDLGDGEAFFSSGNYNQFRETINGGRWGHILDPRSGMPARGAAATGVLVDDPALADAASTALSVAGPSGFAHIVAQMKIRCAVMVTDENELLITTAMQKRMQFQREPVLLGKPLNAGTECSSK